MKYLFFLAVLYIGWRIFHDSNTRKDPPRQESEHVADPWASADDPFGDYNEGFDDDDLR